MPCRIVVAHRSGKGMPSVRLADGRYQAFRVFFGYQWVRARFVAMRRRPLAASGGCRLLCCRGRLMRCQKYLEAVGVHDRSEWRLSRLAGVEEQRCTLRGIPCDSRGAVVPYNNCASTCRGALRREPMTCAGYCHAALLGYSLVARFTLPGTTRRTAERVSTWGRYVFFFYSQ